MGVTPGAKRFKKRQPNDRTRKGPATVSTFALPLGRHCLLGHVPTNIELTRLGSLTLADAEIPGCSGSAAAAIGDISLADLAMAWPWQVRGIMRAGEVSRADLLTVLDRALRGEIRRRPVPPPEPWSAWPLIDPRRPYQPHERPILPKETLAGRELTRTERERAEHIRLDALPISVRAHNVLFHSGMQTLFDLTQTSDVHVFKLKNCGKKTLAELRALVLRFLDHGT